MNKVEIVIKVLGMLGIDTWFLTDRLEESTELFFIKKQLDMHRQKKVRHMEVMVYRDFSKEGKEYRGSSSVFIEDGMGQEEMTEVLKNAYYAAAFVENPFYELPAPKEEEAPAADNQNFFCGLVREEEASPTLKACGKVMAEALFYEDVREDVFLNSAEIFVTKSTVEMKSSRGIHASYIRYNVNGEFVVQAPEPQDVETYQSFQYDSLNTRALREKVKNALILTKDRALAECAPKAGKYTVILSGEYVAELMDFYVQRSNGAMIYPRYSNYTQGACVQGEKRKGDGITITLKARTPYSGEGIPMKDRLLMEDGVLKTIHGNCRYSYYLHVEPTGGYPHGSMGMPPGKVSLEEWKKQPCLHIVNFSDFQMNSYSGHFGGEIRLAYYWDGEKEIPVTGGSINGSLLEAQKSLEFSLELQEEKGFSGPLAVALRDIIVAGN